MKRRYVRGVGAALAITAVSAFALACGGITSSQSSGSGTFDPTPTGALGDDDAGAAGGGQNGQTSGGGTTNGGACVPGHKVSCDGPDLCVGERDCFGMGIVGPCVCVNPPANGTGGAGGMGNGAGSGGGTTDGGPMGPGMGASDAGSNVPSDADAPSPPPLDAYAPLPPPVGSQPYNAIWSAKDRLVFLPLFSAPSCAVVPPYGEYYAAQVENPSPQSSPAGSFTSCSVADGPGATACYYVERLDFDPMTVIDWENVPGGMYTLSAFDSDGIARGQMNTTEGIVPLVVKSCP